MIRNYSNDKQCRHCQTASMRADEGTKTFWYLVYTGVHSHLMVWWFHEFIEPCKKFPRNLEIKQRQMRFRSVSFSSSPVKSKWPMDWIDMSIYIVQWNCVLFLVRFLPGWVVQDCRRPWQQKPREHPRRAFHHPNRRFLLHLNWRKQKMWKMGPKRMRRNWMERKRMIPMIWWYYARYTYIDSELIIIIHHRHLWKRRFVAFLHAKLGPVVCPRVDNQTSGDTLQI